MGQPTVLSCFLWRHHKLKQPLNKMGNLKNHLLSTKDSGDPEPWWASFVRVGASSAWPDIFPQASLHLVQLWLAVSVFIYGLGLLVTPFLCQWFVEPKDKTGLNPYHNKYLFLSEGRASPIYLCIFVQRQVGFQCICNWKKNHFSSKAGFRRIGSLCMPVLSPVDAVYINVRENILLCETDFGCNDHTILH